MTELTIAQELFALINEITSTYINEISTKAITELTPVIVVGMTITFITYGMMIIRGTIDHPIMDFIGQSIRIGIILSIGMAGGLYQSEISPALQTLPDDLATLFTAESGTVANSIDATAQAGFNITSEAFAKAGLFSGEGIVYAFLGIFIASTTAVVLAIGMTTIITAKIALSLLAGLGPFFIFSLLFKPTHRLFDQWIGQILTYALTIIMTSIVFGLILQILSQLVAEVDWGQTNIGWFLGTNIMIAIFSVMILIQIPTIAGALSSGVALSYLQEARALRSGASRTYAAGKRAARETVAAGKATVRAGKATAGASRAAAGYFRGRAGNRAGGNNP